MLWAKYSDFKEIGEEKPGNKKYQTYYEYVRYWMKYKVTIYNGNYIANYNREKSRKL